MKTRIISALIMLPLLLLVYFGGIWLKMAVVTARLDSADVLPFEAVAEDVATQAWLEHRAKVMDKLKKEWKTERPIFSQTDVFSKKDQ